LIVVKGFSSFTEFLKLTLFKFDALQVLDPASYLEFLTIARSHQGNEHRDVAIILKSMSQIHHAELYLHSCRNPFSTTRSNERMLVLPLATLAELVALVLLVLAVVNRHGAMNMPKERRMAIFSFA
jgi:hypothetical protein